ncbi:hypothetical protein M798_11495 [Brucella melitensis ADMAS-G1]|nr:hypothetical protein M798_11495 [Brucella melitensis ADMAS-G1]
MALSTIAVAAMFLLFVCLRQHGNGDGNWGDLLIPVIVTTRKMMRPMRKFCGRISSTDLPRLALPIGGFLTGLFNKQNCFFFKERGCVRSLSSLDGGPSRTGYIAAVAANR